MTELSIIEELTLLALSGGKEQGVSASELRKGLKSLACGQKVEVATVLSRLCEIGHLEEMPRGKGQRSARWKLRSPGQEFLQTQLGTGFSQGRNWRQKAARTLAIVRLLGVEPATASALVRGKDGALPAYFLAMRMGEKFHPSMTPSGLAERAAAAALNLPNGKPATLWRGIFQRGFAPAEPPPPAEVSISEFAVQVKRAARTCKEGWFGPRKLFIHYAWLAWQASTGATAELPDFKQQLLRALQAELIGLSRADFTAGLNPTDLEDGATQYGNETFHFITIEPEDHP